eukprot:CAMPEP_0181386594 /NCGR_PEP_ID=MMETSP1106-20121128/23230_1 /TAXON_ID=81844 /ORGANISM="Mantoniella antarctica, Strain SL-175" /LENGTH=110 /DNA_ID=CAMNT_0023506839 /DNA_START=538 /DNA_END=870 /DNA_ORIENTATION=-
MKQASLSTDVEAKQKQVNNLRTEAHSCTTDAGTKDRNDFDEEGVPLFGSLCSSRRRVGAALPPAPTPTVALLGGGSSFHPPIRPYLVDLRTRLEQVEGSVISFGGPNRRL